MKRRVEFDDLESEHMPCPNLGYAELWTGMKFHYSDCLRCLADERQHDCEKLRIFNAVSKGKDPFPERQYIEITPAFFKPCDAQEK